MAVIVAEHAPMLKAAGFRKRRHGFNRAVADGIVHVVHFWMAPKEPPAWTEVPGLRERRYGSFRVDFGVYVPEMTRTHTPRSDWINDYDCHLRESVGELLTGTSVDFWWRLDDPRSSAEAGHALAEHGLPWLDRFGNRAAVLDAFEQFGSRAIGLLPAGALDIADVYRSTGRLDEERRTLERYVSEPVLRNHASYLAKYLQDRGHGDLVSSIIVRE
jgi:hypothetical protein